MKKIGAGGKDRSEGRCDAHAQKRRFARGDARGKKRRGEPALAGRGENADFGRGGVAKHRGGKVLWLFLVDLVNRGGTRGGCKVMG